MGVNTEDDRQIGGAPQSGKIGLFWLIPLLREKKHTSFAAKDD